MCVNIFENVLVYKIIYVQKYFRYECLCVNIVVYKNIYI